MNTSSAQRGLCRTLVLSGCTIGIAAAAQSFPPGQVTHRVWSKPEVEQVSPVRFSGMMYEIQKPQPKGRIFALEGGKPTCNLSAADDSENAGSAKGIAKAVWAQMVALDQENPAPEATALCTARGVAKTITDTTDAESAKQLITAAKHAAEKQFAGDQNERSAILRLLNSLAAAIPACYESPATSGKTQYEYPAWIPLWRPGCHADDQIENFFSQSGLLTAGNAAKYEYNAQQSASVINADLLTTTFQPGIQLVLAGSATSGSSGALNTTTTSSTTSTSVHLTPHAAATTGTATTTTSTSSSDSASTAVSKLESGGDFNLRIPLPLLAAQKGPTSITGQLTPNIGFLVNGLTSQNTITDSTQYSFNLPLELYGQLTSTTNAATPAVAFFDVKPAGEFLSKTLAQKLGPSVPTAMFLGEAAIGVEFAKKVRISAQYVYGNASVYQSSSSTSTSGGTTSSTTPTKSVSGFHLAVSFATSKQ
jgi:cell division septation protein DedD